MLDIPGVDLNRFPTIMEKLRTPEEKVKHDSKS